MTIEDTIRQYEKIASDYEFNLEMHQNGVMQLSVNDIERMKRFASENHQCAEWLKELLAWRQCGQNIGAYLSQYLTQEQIDQLLSDDKEWKGRE